MRNSAVNSLLACVLFYSSISQVSNITWQTLVSKFAILLYQIHNPEKPIELLFWKNVIENHWSIFCLIRILLNILERDCFLFKTSLVWGKDEEECHQFMSNIKWNLLRLVHWHRPNWYKPHISTIEVHTRLLKQHKWVGVGSTNWRGRLSTIKSSLR